MKLLDSRRLAPFLVLLLHLVLWQILTLRGAGTVGAPDAQKRILLLAVAAPEDLPPPSVALPRPAERTRARPTAALARSTAPAAASPDPQRPGTPILSQPFTPVPTLDLDTLRGQALAIDRQRNRSGIKSLQENRTADLTMEDRLGQNIARATPADCRTSYRKHGLLALIPLAVDALNGNGCKW